MMSAPRSAEDQVWFTWAGGEVGLGPGLGLGLGLELEMELGAGVGGRGECLVGLLVGA